MAKFIWRDSKAALKAVDVSTDFADGDAAKVYDSGIVYDYVYNSAGTGGDTDTYIDATTGAGGWDMQLLPPINIGSSDPVSPSTNDVWVNTTSNQLKVKTATGTIVFEAFQFVAD